MPEIIFKTIARIILMISIPSFIISCNKDYTHPCNFPDEFTENTFRENLSYKIIDYKTSINLVDTIESAPIHLDSVYLMTEDFDTITTEYEYYIDNWAFTNFYPYYGISTNNSQELLDLNYRIFYLRTSYNDLDTIEVYYNQCLIDKVLFNNTSTNVPYDEPYEGSASLYFRK